MKKETYLIVIGLALFGVFPESFAQIGIGTNTPSQSAQLDVVSSNRGVLIPRVDLQNNTDTNTISAGNVVGLLVYNEPAKPSLAEGFYFWNGSVWRSLSSIDTSLTFDETNNRLIYLGTNGTQQFIDIDQVLDFQETPTSIALNSTTDSEASIDYTGEDGHTTELALISNDANNDLIYSTNGLYVNTATKEPWFNLATNTGATANTDNIYIDGQVLIGDTDLTGFTTTAQLFVDGTIETASSTYPDYVFEDYFDGHSVINSTYKFNTLEEITDYILLNRHLPGVAGIQELHKNEKGEYRFNLSKLSMQLLEKVEELYLHTIEQHDALKEKDEKIIALEARLDKIEALLGTEK